MLAVNHDVLRAFKEVRSDDIEKITSSVWEKAKKEGVRITKVEARTAVQNVDQLLRRAKSDELGTFLEKSVTVQPRNTYLKVPEFWGDILTLLDCDGHEGCLIVGLCDQQNLNLYKCDLLISSEDLNTSNFRKQLGSCLLQDNCVIYVDVSKLTIRGSERLMAILRDFKKLFDNRLLLVLFTRESLLPGELLKLTELSLNSQIVNSPPAKKLKMCNSLDVTGNSDFEKKLSKLQCNLGLCEKEISSLKSKLEDSVSKEEKLDCDNRKLKEDHDIYKKETADRHAACMGEIKNHQMKELELEQVIMDLKCRNESLEKQVKSKPVETVKEPADNNVFKIGPGGSTKVCATEKQLETSQAKTNNVKSSQDRDDNSNKCNRDRAEKLKLKISNIEKEFAAAGPLEILKRSLNIFEFNLNFSNKIHQSDLFVCTIKINRIDTEFEHYKEKDWVGKDISKKLAKRDAFLNILNAFK